MNIESRGGSLPQRSSDELRAQLNLKNPLGQNFSPQAAHIQQLEEKLSEVQQQLEKETRRSHLLEQELAHLRSLTLQHTKHQSSSPSTIVAQQPLPELLAKQAASKQLDHELHPQLRARARSIDGKTSSLQSDSRDDIHRVCSAPAGPAIMTPRPASMDKAVSSALHAVSGAYLKQQAQLQSSSLAIRQQPMSEAESKARQFIEQAQPVLLGEASNIVTISKQAFELLVLKDRAINAVKEGITIADCSLPDHPLIFANDAFSKITGYSREEALGKNCRFLQGPGTDEEEIQKMRDAAREGKPSVVQLLNYKKNGDPFINYLSITPIHDSRGHVTHFVGIQSDISDLVNHKKAELAAKHEAAQAAAATEVKSQFLARMSHEIRTPLNGMIAVGQLLAETTLSPSQWDLMNTIRCSGETLLTLITDILDFSRIEADKMVLAPTEFHLQTVIEAAMEIAGLHAAQKRLQVAYNVADNVPKLVTCDAQRLQQVLLNVLNNAVKFTEKGEVLLEVWCEESTSEASAKQAQHAQQGLGSSHVPMQSTRQESGDALQPQQEPLLSTFSKDSAQHVQIRASRLEPFRPLTPDNLSQHTEFADMRQQMQGPNPKDDLGDALNTEALAASFDVGCNHGNNCSCPPPSTSTCSNFQQQRQHESQHEPTSSSLQQQQPATDSISQSEQSTASANSFLTAAPATTKAGRQHIMDVSTASAAPRAAADSGAEVAAETAMEAGLGAAPEASAAPHSEAQRRAGLGEGFESVAEQAIDEPSRSESRRHKINGNTDGNCSGRQNSMASTSGRSVEDTGFYTLNFSVKDSGIGISDESVKNLFQCFAQVDASPTRRFGGSGLGLAICKKLTEAMGGHMWVESGGLGKGSVFRWTLQAKGHNTMLPRSASTSDKDMGTSRNLSSFSTSSNSSGGTSKSGGARALHHNRSSTEWQRGSGSQSGSTVESGLAMFAGKKVLLVEVCDMVRQVLTLALRRWGFQVCAVKNEEDAINKLTLQGGHSDFLAACKRRAEGKLSLEHSGTDVQNSKLCNADGPYDVVILDMALSQLVLALMQGVESEASTLVFLGWPGQNEPEDDDLNALDANGPALTSPMHSQGSAYYPDSVNGLTLGSNPISAQMSQDTVEKMSNRPIGSKQLMYAIVTRPVRQGRLKLALEEVLTTQPNPSDPTILQTPNDHASAPTATGSPQALSAGLHSRSASNQSAGSLGNLHPSQVPASPAALRISQDAQPEWQTGGRRDSTVSSGRLSNASSASGSLLPAPIDLSHRSSAVSSPSSHGTDFEFALQSRRHSSLQRAPKLRGHGSYSELAEVEGSRRFLKVLLAEDNLINMKVALGILKRTGYSEVTTVEDGQQAMDELHRRGGADAFDVILTDLHMPHKGGMEMVTEIRQLWPNSRVRVVAVTADAFEDRRDQCLASGFDGWLAKPFRIEDLVKIMEAVS